MLAGLNVAASPIQLDARGKLTLPGGWSGGELHLHTTHSDGTRTLVQNLRRAAEIGLDVIAVTDHDKVREALRAHTLASDFGLDAVIGTEITCRTQHHVLGLFIRGSIRIYQTMADTVRAIRDQGGLAILAHPFMGVPNASNAKRILSWLETTDFDGIELESQYLNPRRRERLHAFYLEHSERLGAAIGGTDAHFGDLGRYLTLFPGSGAAALRAAIVNRRTVAARSELVYDRPQLRDLALNNYRSLLCLSIYRLRAVSGGSYQ